MSPRPLIVLKFGSSILKDETFIPDAIHEIYRWHRVGYRVVAVVSALHGTTDRLLAQGRAYNADPDGSALAALAATGEATAAALVGLALDRAGLCAHVLDPAQIDLRTRGTPLDSEAISVNARVIESALDERPIAVIPGFVGRLDDGRQSLLGRGGSDLSALFLARELQAEKCRLVKDVDGLYEFDPARPGPPPKRYRTINFDDALAIDGRIVQHKSVKYARQHGFGFEVGTLQNDRFTLVHAGPSRLEPLTLARPPLRVGVLGLGVVGRGVVAELLRQPDRFTVTGIAVRDIRRHAESGVPTKLLTSDPWTVVHGPCEVVIEALSGGETARVLIEAALKAGKKVVTANKAAVAQLSAACIDLVGTSLWCSASVGGAVPVVETACRIAKDRGVKQVEGVLNGTCNFVLDAVADGATFDEAVAAAQKAGFAEADPSADLDGIDAANKLIVLARLALGVHISPGDVLTTGIRGIDEAATREAADTNCTYRLVARVRRAGSGVVATVEPRLLPNDHPFAQVKQERNAAIIFPFDGEQTIVTGRGAGRWPTTEAVLGDLFEAARLLSQPAKEPLRAISAASSTSIEPKPAVTGTKS